VADLGVVTGLLLGAGATIMELNAVRTHLSAVGGGRLAVAGGPGRTIVLVVSDVVGDGVPLAPPSALGTGGEATVTVQGAGRGGRNQESCLAAVPWLKRHPVAFLSAGTDGIDGNTTAAGAIVDGGSAARARAAGVDINRAVRENDSGSALTAMGDTLTTGPTGTNVADVRLLLSGGPPWGPADG
jgi:glycerate 2-kinase